MAVDHLEKRLARLAPKTPAPAAPKAPATPKVDFITVPPAQRNGRGTRIVAALVLGLGLALAAKGLVHAQLGTAELDRMRQDLAEGSPWQRGLALALHPDPVSFALARQFGLPGPENSGDAVRINHESDVTMIEVEPGQEAD